MPADYTLVGKRARVHLYTREGILIGTLEGRIADVAKAVVVGKDAEGRDIHKDLALLVDISTQSDVPYRNSAGEENEGWFAVQDLEILDENQPEMRSPLLRGVKFN